MKIAITGSSGLIGTALQASLEAEGDTVLRLVRGYPRADNEVRFDPVAGILDPAALAGVNAVVNLAGAGTGDKRWSEDYKRQILESRTSSTRTVVQAILSMDHPVPVLVSSSAMGIYGQDRGEEVLTEASAEGAGFLADVCRAWEAETAPASDGGIRVAHLRTGLVMSRHGGVLARILPFFKSGVGGPLGRGRMWWSPISLDDQVRAIRHLVVTDGATGAFNCTAPEPVRNAEFSKALGGALGRPSLVPVPPPALKALFGEFAGDILGSLRVLPSKLEASGFAFHHPDAPAIIAAALD